MCKGPAYSGTVIQLQECKGPSERSFNRAVDKGFVGDLGSLGAANLQEEDPVVDANKINY